MNDIITRRIPLPYGIKGLVIEDPAGDYNVYTAEWLSPDAEREVLEHEDIHIHGGHLDSDVLPVEFCENIATYYVNRRKK